MNYLENFKDLDGKKVLKTKTVLSKDGRVVALLTFVSGGVLIIDSNASFKIGVGVPYTAIEDLGLESWMEIINHEADLANLPEKEAILKAINEEVITFKSFLIQHKVPFDKFVENCKTENQRWDSDSARGYYTISPKELFESNPKNFIGLAFNWNFSLLGYSDNEFWELQNAWRDELENAVVVEFE